MGINRNVHFRVGSSAERDGLHRLGELQPVTVGSKKRRVGPDGVMVATNGPEGSSRVRERPFREMMERLIANRAALHTRMYTFTSISGIKQGGDQMRWSMDIGRVTGGSYDGLSSAIGFRTQLPELAEDLGRKHRLMSNQYLLTYTPPEGRDRAIGHQAADHAGRCPDDPDTRREDSVGVGRAGPVRSRPSPESPLTDNRRFDV